MSKRKKIENRQIFSRSERLEILEKSNCKCSHCGVDLIGFFTVDHVIPLNKGGTNDSSNLVALCEECNKAKDDLIVDPSSYFKYVKSGILDILIKNQEKFCEEFEWLSQNNILPTDIKEIKIAYSPRRFNSMLSKVKKNGAHKAYYTTITCYIKRATENKLKEIVDFCYSVSLLSNTNNNKEKLISDEVNYWFKNGAIYYLTNKDDSIRAVVPVVFDSFNDKFDTSIKESKANGIIPYFPPAYLYKRDFNHDVAVTRVYIYILSNMVKVLERPVYYISNVSSFLGLGSLLALDTVSQLMKEAYTLDIKRFDNSLVDCWFSGKWDSSDDSLLGSSDIEQFKDMLRHSFSLEPVEFKDFKLNTSLGKPYYYKSANLDLEKFLSKRRSFGKFLARQLDYRINTETKPVSIEDPYETIDLPFDKLKTPKGVVLPNIIPPYIKNQLKCGGLRPIEITSTYEVRKSDLNIYAYYKQQGVKSIKCRYKKGIVLEDYDVQN